MPAIVFRIGCVHPLQRLRVVDFFMLRLDDVTQPDRGFRHPHAFAEQYLQNPVTFGR